MFVLKKLITPFLLPPGFFILLLIGIGIWGLRRKEKLATAGAFVVAGLIWLFSISPTADLLMAGLEKGLTFPENIEADVILMLGGGVNAKAPDFSGIGAPGPSTIERLVTAARLHRKLGVPIVVSSGRVYKREGASIAELAKRFLVDLGVPSQMVITENRSRDTYENALFSKQICHQHGFTNPLLVTSASHMKRALVSFAKVDMAVTAMPCGLTTWQNKRHGWNSFLPSRGALHGSATAMHEWIGLIYYKMAY